MKKTIIENFTKNENEIKVALLKEIKEAFEGYKTEEVLFYTIFDNEEIDGFDELETMMHDVCPQIVNDYNQIDETALPHSICYEDDELILKVYGEYSNPNRDYITLEKPSYDLTVNGLYNILLILQHPSFKRIIEQIEYDKHHSDYMEELFNKYSDMKIVCPTNRAETTLKEFFNSITDDEDNVVEEFSEWLEDGEEEEQTIYEAFVAALQHNNWFENNGIEDSNNIIITGLNDRTLFDDKLENLEAY